MRKTTKFTEIIITANILPQNISIPSEKSNFVNSSIIHEPSDEPAMNKFAERKIITNPARSENGRRTNAKINGTGMATKPALLNNQAYGGATFWEPRFSIVESPSFMLHSNSLPQCGHSNLPGASESSFTSPWQWGQRISTMNGLNANTK